MRKYTIRNFCREIEASLVFCGYVTPAAIELDIEKHLPDIVLGEKDSMERILYIMMTMFGLKDFSTNGRIAIQFRLRDKRPVLRLSYVSAVNAVRDDKKLNPAAVKILKTLDKLHAVLYSERSRNGSCTVLEVPFQLEKNTPPISIASLVSSFGDEETAGKVVSCYIQAVKSEFKQLAESVLEGKAGEIHRLAHSIRGGALSIHAEGLAKAAEHFEEEVREEKLHACDQHLQNINRELLLVTHYVKNHWPVRELERI
jgi:HPt (histidine-containing phosphotransfer) domain-containing protein